MIREICDPPHPVTGVRSTRRAPSTDMDHIFPREAGGSNHDENGSGRVFLPSILHARDNADS